MKPLSGTVPSWRGEFGEALEGRRVLVTGATGFIGGHLCDALLALEARVHGLARKASQETLPPGCFPEAVDLSDAQAVDETLRRLRPEIVFHLGGLVTGRQDRSLVLPMLHHNLMGMVHILMASLEAGVGRIVFTGSSEEVYGELDGVPFSPYAAAKTAGTLYARMFHRLYGLPVVIVRPFMVYGPGQEESKLIPHTILSLLSGKPPRLSSGERVYDFVYVEDVVRGLLKAALLPNVMGQEIELGTGIGVRIRELVALIIEITGSQVQPLFGAVADRVGERSRIADLQKAKSLLAWEPRWLLRDGLTETVAWYRIYIARRVETHGKG